MKDDLRFPIIKSIVPALETWVVRRGDDKKYFACAVDAIGLVEDKDGFTYLAFYECDSNGDFESIDGGDTQHKTVFHGNQKQVLHFVKQANLKQAWPERVLY